MPSSPPKERSVSENSPNPILVEVTRGETVESCHRGSAIAMRPNGEIIAQWGNTAQETFPRSSIKPLQAIPLIESGAADAYNLTPEELALACASHNGEPMHVKAVDNWLKRIGLGISDLECGEHWPMWDKAARALAAEGQQPNALHNNCSGKHAGFLTTALHLGMDLQGYIKKEHPLQQTIFRVITEICDVEPTHQIPCGSDGCSIPTWAMPLENLALGMARFSSPASFAPDRADAVTRIFTAMTSHPEMVAGSERYCSEVMAATDGRLMVKTGAEGVFFAALPEQEIGIALKCDDGATRASEAIMTSLLFHLELLTDQEKSRLEKRINPQIINWNGITVGEIRAAEPLSLKL